MTSPATSTFEDDVARGKRFEFGKNWTAFLATIDDERIAEAVASLRQMLGVESLAGRSFVDVGCGSGLFSLAAMRLGAARVHALDYDPRSVACARELKRRFFPNAEGWTIEQASALDHAHLSALGQFDVVYSWGVLHHTGDMWRGLENVTSLVNEGGTLFVAIYNDQGWLSRAWRAVKRIYNSGRPGRWLITGSFCAYFAASGVLADLARLKNPIRRYAEYKRSRGMSRVHDWIDWLGGLPFEVASAEAIFSFYKQRGFHLENLHVRAPGHGCNELVLSKTRAAPALARPATAAVVAAGGGAAS